MQESAFGDTVIEPDCSKLFQLRLEDACHAVLDAVCNEIGFSFATISLRDDDQQEIRTVASRNIPPGWQAEAHHPLDSHDIQADVLRTGKIEVISGWDARFDRYIWEKYRHAELIRVWVPLGRLGTIEAGFARTETSLIPPLLTAALARYARSATDALRNAQAYERVLRHATTLAHLYESADALRTEPEPGDELALLTRFAETALSVLKASIILLYPLKERNYLMPASASVFAPPICAGDIEGRQKLKTPAGQANIVRHIAETRAPYYQPDAQSDPLLTTPDLTDEHVKRRSRLRYRTFTARQQIRSFAGVPLLARGAVLGVLCVNYRERRQFDPHDRQVIELFASQASAVIASNELIRGQERKRLEADLHDTVKSEVRGIALLSNSATDAIETDLERARMCLHELRRGAWTILADVNLILDKLSASSDEQGLEGLIQAEIDRQSRNGQATPVARITTDVPPLSFRLARVVASFIREALVNAVEHSEAQNISVTGCVDGRWLNIDVDDDGLGFDPLAPLGRPHRGLEIMRMRAREIGGEVKIESAPGKGTSICARFPIEED